MQVTSALRDLVPKAPPPATPAAPGSGAVTGAVTPAAPPGVAFPSMGGAVSQAVQAGAATSKAAGDQMAGDPLIKEYMNRAAQADAAQKAVVPAVQANLDEVNKIAREEPPPTPSIPRLKPLPEAPVKEPSDPMRVMGQLLPVLAVLGSLRTSQPATNALNALAAGVNAAKAKDKEEFERQHQTWLENMKVTVETNNQLVQQYSMALDDKKATMTERLARINALAAANQDNLVLATLKSPTLQPLANLIQMRMKLGEQLNDIMQFAVHEDTTRTIAADNALRGWAEVRVAEANAGKYSPNDVAGPIFRKMSATGFDSLTDAEKSTLAQISSYEAAMHPSPMAQTIAAATAGGGNPYGAAPATAGPVSPPTAAMGPAAAATAPTSPGPVATGVLDARTAQAKAALGRGAPREQVKAAWMQQGLPPEEFDKRVK